MPLFHIGGILSNLLGSLVSGGAVACLEQRFEPTHFLNQLVACGATWYYASPSIHLALVATLQAGGTAGAPCPRLRLIRSGAAALPLALQVLLEDRFRCPVHATYSMTECMP
eukprot:CAMPEP_0198557542 /NCGR_PEP_ID=MMETSP1462-20131121/88846_1 /TAXON_ID=1333877 /ORGANISM="Brandtodinium nutriculum, Strain RCC3387" /LENGTH=111 /DNA_ID=CAMNT_0044288329 /DNA_START=39 /DNA_END=371 /DNA_ORIENTATION=-